jgi:hypothetical protein
MFNKAVPQGRLSARARAGSEQRGETYTLPCVEPPSDASTQPADLFNIVLEDTD